MRVYALPLLTTFAPLLAWAEPTADAPPTDARPPYVSVHVGFELHALERAAQDTAKAVEGLSKAVNTLAANPALTEDQKAQLKAIIGRVDGLSGKVTTAIDKMPDTVKGMHDPVVQTAQDLAAQVRITVIIALAALLLVVVLILVGVLYLVILPSRKMVEQTASTLTKVLGSVSHTVELFQQASATQLELARALQALANMRSVEVAKAAGRAQPDREQPTT